MTSVVGMNEQAKFTDSLPWIVASRMLLKMVCAPLYAPLFVWCWVVGGGGGRCLPWAVASCVALKMVSGAPWLVDYWIECSYVTVGIKVPATPNTHIHPPTHHPTNPSVLPPQLIFPVAALAVKALLSEVPAVKEVAKRTPNAAMVRLRGSVCDLCVGGCGRHKQAAKCMYKLAWCALPRLCVYARGCTLSGPLRDRQAGPFHCFTLTPSPTPSSPSGVCCGGPGQGGQGGSAEMKPATELALSWLALRVPPSPGGDLWVPAVGAHLPPSCGRCSNSLCKVALYCFVNPLCTLLSMALIGASSALFLPPASVCPSLNSTAFDNCSVLACLKVL